MEFKNKRVRKCHYASVLNDRNINEFQTIKYNPIKHFLKKISFLGYIQNNILILQRHFTRFKCKSNIYNFWLHISLDFFDPKMYYLPHCSTFIYGVQNFHPTISIH